MDGRAHASHDGEPGRALATGDGIGSSALLEGAPFDLSLVCDTEVATLVLDRHGLERLIDEAPSAARRIIRALSAHAAPRSAPGSRSV
jgi:CRP-like cAMP-binding protein